MKIYRIGLIGVALMASGFQSAASGEIMYPISIYMTYDGRGAEGINRSFHDGKFNLYSLTIPLYAGIVVVKANGELNCFEKHDFIAQDLREECRAINSRNGVIEFVEPQIGHGALRGVSKTNPRFVEAFKNMVLVQHGFHVVRITYGDEPDLSWSPNLENVRAYVPIEERVRREEERKRKP